MSLRFFVLIQASNILLKMDGILAWNWKAIFWSSWILLLILVFYGIGLLLITVCTAFYVCFGDAKTYQSKPPSIEGILSDYLT